MLGLDGAIEDAVPVVDVDTGCEPPDGGEVGVADVAPDTALADGTFVVFLHCKLAMDGAVAFDDSVKSAHCLEMQWSELALERRGEGWSNLVKSPIVTVKDDLKGHVRPILEVRQAKGLNIDG